MSDTPPAQAATPRTNAVASQNWSFEAECVHADFARQLETELTAARAQVEEKQSEMDRQLREHSTQQTICNDNLSRAWNERDELRIKVAELTAEVKYQRDAAFEGTAVIARLTAEVERLKIQRETTLEHLMGARADKQSLLCELTDERTRSAKLVEALETAQRRFENAASALSMHYGAERTQEAQRLLEWARNTANALTDSRSSAVEPSAGVPVEVRPDTPETREEDLHAERALAESIAKDYDRESAHVEPSAVEVTQKDELVTEILTAFACPESWPMNDAQRCDLLRKWFTMARKIRQTESA